jgi:hypothetical protein
VVLWKNCSAIFSFPFRINFDDNPDNQRMSMTDMEKMKKSGDKLPRLNGTGWRFQVYEK